MRDIVTDAIFFTESTIPGIAMFTQDGDRRSRVSSSVRTLHASPDTPGLPVLKPREVIRILERLGFVEVRQRGSHRQFRHPERIGCTLKRQSGSRPTLSCPGWPDVVFAFHDAEEIGPRMVGRLAKKTGLTPGNL